MLKNKKKNLKVITSIRTNDKVQDSDFSFVQRDEVLHDVKFETKPVSFLKDSVRRFAKNKASIVAFAIICGIILFAIVGQFSVKTSDAFKNEPRFGSGYDSTFKEVLPKAFKAGSGFWDGCGYEDLIEDTYYFKKYSDANHPVIIEDDLNPTTKYNEVTQTESKYYHVKIDTYADAANIKSFGNLTEDDFKVLEKEDKSRIANGLPTIIKPNVDYDTYIHEYEEQLLEEGINQAQVNGIITNITSKYQGNDYIYYKLVATKNNKGKYTNKVIPLLDENKLPIPLYVTDENGNLVYGEKINGLYTVRVDYLDYFEFKYGFEPMYYFGTNNQGQDLFLRLSNGTGFSLLLGLGVTVVNFLIGLVYGAISGYYGGRVDLIMERITDILAAIPSVVIMTLVSLNIKNNAALGNSGPIIALLIGFIATGWIGTASTTRMQFYRFKNQEYVLASRTLGAKDRRLIFKHILPNAAGTLVTSTVLMVPSVIFSESTLTYLGIINLSLGNLSSIGTLLSEGQKVLPNTPYLIVFPAVIISLLMICFNLFGNGLRDAFNTQLRGED